MFFVRHRYVDSAIGDYFFIALLFKIGSGFALGFLFYYHYGVGDTISFFETAKGMATLEVGEFFNVLTNPTVSSQPVRAIYFVRGVAVLVWLTHADYWLVSIYFSVISFLGAFYLTYQLSRWSPKLTRPVLVSFLFFPSIVFWSSGLLKESVVFVCMTYLLGMYFSYVRKSRLNKIHFLLGALALFVLIVIKYYIAAVFLPLIGYLVLYHIMIDRLSVRWSIWQYSIVIFIVMLVPSLLFLNWLSPNLTYEHLWRVVSENHAIFLKLKPKDSIHSLVWFDNRLDVVINVFHYLISGIYRPFIWENLSFPSLIAGLENLGLLGITIYALIRIKRVEVTAELLAVVIYVVILGLFLSYSAPTFGTLARYKVYYMPFFLLLVLSGLDSIKKE